MLSSFAPEYHTVLQCMPLEALPETEKHGKHSYTISCGPNKQAKVEVLLKQQAFKAKYDCNSVKMETTSHFDS